MTDAPWDSSEPDRKPRPLWFDAIILTLAAIIFVTMIGLGNWQVQRLAWKVDLIEAVETRAFGEPVGVPRGVGDANEYAYLRVTLDGTFRHDVSVRVKALTELGNGSWVLTPLVTDEGTFWVNRGFVPQGLEPNEIEQPDGPVSVTGLLRVTEPEGTLLEKNRPEDNRWFSRDIIAMSQWLGVVPAETYFIDAEHSGGVQGWPRGGLTKVEFPNNHLSYAITWYAMAALFFGGMVIVVRDRMKRKAEAATERWDRSRMFRR